LPRIRQTGSVQERIQQARDTRATELYLDFCNLTAVPDEVRDLTEIQRLDLRGNDVRELPKWLSELSRLTELDLSSNGLSEVPRQIERLPRLSSLHLSGNRLSELPDWISGLECLSELNVEENPLTVMPQWLRSASHLTELMVGGSSQAELPSWFGELAWLQELLIYGSGLTTLPDWFRELRGLRVIGLTRHDLNSLPEWLTELNEIQSLYLGYNKFTHIPQCITELPKLRNLFLHDNRIECLPSRPGVLLNLSKLTLSDNLLTELPEWLRGLKQLKTLMLDGFRGSLPLWLGELTTLTYLAVGSHGMTALPSWVRNLTMLETLRMDGSSFTEVPEFVVDLPCLEDVEVYRSPIQNPPLEVCSEGTPALLEYLRDVRDTGEPQWQSRMIVVGEAAVGKTSVTRALCGLSYDPEEPQTHGVHLDPLDLSGALPSVQARLNVWDFGGQLEYRATQRFYLSGRSLFLLVWNRRRGWRAGGQVEAWLDAISNAAPEAPIIVVATHSRDSVADLDTADIRRRFPQVAGFLEVDCADGLGIEALRAAIVEHARKLPLMGVRWPASWCRAAEALEREPGRSITRRRATTILDAEGVTSPGAQVALLRALHDRGQILHFPSDPLLREHVILQPSWVDSMMTRILDSRHLAAQGGVLTRLHRAELWHDIDDPGLIEMLTALMERFDLAYRLDAPDHEDVALVVERLPAGAPPDLDRIWASALDTPDATELHISYKLPSRQAGVPSWFIAREHRFTTGTAWSGGVLLQHRGGVAPATALLTDDGLAQPTVRLAVRGPEPHTFLSILNEGFSGILTERYPGMHVRCMVPCPCGGDPEAGNAAGRCNYEFEYSMVQRMLSRGKTLQCNESGEQVSPAELLLGLRTVPLQESLHEIKETLADLVKTTGRVERNQLLVLDSVRDLLRRRGEQPDRCPGIFTITKSGKLHYELRLYCEQPDQPHALPDDAGVYQLTALPVWLSRYAPYLKVVLTGLKLALPLIAPGFGTVASTALPDRLDSGIELTCKLLEDLPERLELDAEAIKASSETGRRRAPDFEELRKALLALDPDFGGLRERELPESRDIVYLCEHHRAALRYPAQ
jgi:internalin A